MEMDKALVNEGVMMARLSLDRPDIKKMKMRKPKKSDNTHKQTIKTKIVVNTDKLNMVNENDEGYYDDTKSTDSGSLDSDDFNFGTDDDGDDDNVKRDSMMENNMSKEGVVTARLSTNRPDMKLRKMRKPKTKEESS